jgi:hypothetical protein
MNHLRPSPKNDIRVISNFPKIRRDICKSRCTTSINNTGGKFATGINNTAAYFATLTAGVIDTSGKFATGVNVGK